MIFKTIADQPKRRFTLGKLLLALLFLVIAAILGLVVVAYLPQNHRIKDTVLQTTFGFNIAMIVILMFIAIYYIYFRNKKRAVIGTLELKSTEIILNNQTFPISTIRHLRIVGNDILGEFRGYATKGSNNQIFIELISGDQISSSFMQTTTINLKSAAEILKKYHKLGILTESNLATILNNTNYY